MPSLSRRSILKTAALASLAIPAQHLRAESPKGCPLGFGTYGLPGFTLEESIKLVSETGFDSIEIVSIANYHGAPDQVPPAQRKDIRKLLADSKLQIRALMGMPEPGKKNTTWFKQLLELSNNLNPDKPPMIQSVLGGGKWEEKKNLFRDSLGPWIELASNAGVHLAIKPHRGHAMSRPEEGIWLIEQLDAKGKLSLVYDYSHYAYRDMPAEETVATALPYTGYLVMKDAVQKDEKVQFQLPGESREMPHARILKLFYEGGYRGEVCCEVSSQVWRSDSYDSKKAIATCYKNLTEIFTEAGVPRLNT